MARSVNCAKYGEDLEGLEAPPFDGDLGREIFERVSARAWSEWEGDIMIKIINEYRLDMTNNEHYEVLLKQMKAFFNLEGGEEEVLEVENEERGRK